MTESSAHAEAPLVVKGWSIYAHPVFLDQLEGLIDEVEGRKNRDSETWRKKNCTKRLAAIFKLVSDVIPTDPGAPVFRQGDTLGSRRKHWFRAMFFQQYRLFYRFDSGAKIILLAWMNDERSLRAFGRKTDACATFRGMLDRGTPPDSLETLMKASVAAAERFEKGLKAAPLR